jgi:hypothetical protein
MITLPARVGVMLGHKVAVAVPGVGVTVGVNVNVGVPAV